MGKYFQEELQRRGLTNYIPTMEKIFELRKKGDNVLISNQCKCWPEVSCLNDDSIEWSQIEIWMYNIPQEEGGTIQIRSKDNQLLDTIKVHYCPLCGRFLG